MKTIINESGDTLIVMHVEDAKLLLQDLLEYEITDSILRVYEQRDSLNSNTIILQKSAIDLLKEQNANQKDIISNLKKINNNKDTEISKKDMVIKSQKKEARKQRRLKVLGYITTIVLPIAVLLIK